MISGGGSDPQPLLAGEGLWHGWRRYTLFPAQQNTEISLKANPQPANNP